MNSQQEFEVNKAAILEVLRSAGATAAVVEYDGSGDSGGVELMEINGLASRELGNALRQTPVAETVVKRRWDAAAGRMDPEPTVTTRASTLEVALENLLWMAVALASRSGWENDGGGGGTFTVDVKTGIATLEHYDNYVDVVHTNWSDGETAVAEKEL